MRHPTSIWTDPDNADYLLAELREAYRTHLATGSQPVAEGTIVNYERAVASLEAA
jgi:hypothetical protein